MRQGVLALFLCVAILPLVRQYDFDNLFMYTGNTLALRMGYDGGFNRLNSNSEINFNGSYDFDSAYDD